jgi:hypothetical protein
MVVNMTANIVIAKKWQFVLKGKHLKTGKKKK